MLIEAAKGGHTTVVQMLIDYPNSLVTTAGSVVQQQVQGGAVGPPPGGLDASLEGVPAASLPDHERVPPPGSEAIPLPTKMSSLR